MSFTIQTNVSSLIAQENLRVNNDFQGRTISRLTSGYRINASGDDAAGLAVANKFRSDVAELLQGVRNANDGLSQLQIIDGGLKNISQALDRLKTLSTQSASATFTGNRATVNEEYQQLLGEIDRQAANIGLNNGGRYNKSMSVYIGGAGLTSAANAKVSFDLSGTANRVDSTALNLSGSSVGASGVELGNAQTGYVTTAQTFTIATVDSSGVATSSTFVYTAGATVTAQQAITDLNAQVAAWAPGSYQGIAFALKDGTTQKVVIGGNGAFEVIADAIDATDLVTSGITTAVSNKAMYWDEITLAAATGDHSVTFTNSAGQSRTVAISNGDSVTMIVSRMNASLSSIGVYTVQLSATAVSVQSTGAFTGTHDAAAEGGFTGVTIDDTAADTSLSATAAAELALAKVSGAVTLLGGVQGRVGAAQNKLQYAIQLAQAQINNFSAAESRIRDADMAMEAANLTKSQVLQQASLAALAQANTAPQAVLTLLRG
ncbi:MAG: hypothetical protein FJW34_12500 [Acidobacteria bacterium]|nr:hypothetical protein [Acidobacteriota bacterium]